MSKYLLRLYDYKIRTNYIERVLEAEDRLSALNQIKRDPDIMRESIGKLSTSKSISQIVDDGSYDLIELSP